MNYYLVRHGEIEANVKKVYAGWSEEGLTPKGIMHAEKAGQALKEKEIEAIYCSPLQRAVQTAEIIGDFLKIDPIVENSFKELRLGIWEGMSEVKVAREFPEEWKVWNERPADLVLEGRETLGELQERVLKGLEKVKEEGLTVNSYSLLVNRGEKQGSGIDSRITNQQITNNSGTRSADYAEENTEVKDMKVVVVTHVAVIRVEILSSEGRDLNEYRKIPVPNGSVFVIRY